MSDETFLKLPVIHRADQDEFAQAIHLAQNIVLSRPAVESYNLKHPKDPSP